MPYTFSATGTVIVHTGATPVFADIRERDANIDPEAIERDYAANESHHSRPLRRLNPRYGCDQLIARRHSLKVLEDAAHAIGTRYKGTPIGVHSDAVAFSFYANKTMTTGEGGALASHDEEFSNRVRVLTLHGMTRDAWKRYYAGGNWRYDIVEFGQKDNLTDLAGALGRQQLIRLEEFIERRTRAAQRYFANLADEENLLLPHFGEENRTPWHLFVIRIKDSSPVPRDEVIVNSRTRHPDERALHPAPLLHGVPKAGPLAEGRLPRCRRFHEGAISLPMYADLTDDMVDEVCTALREAQEEFAESPAFRPRLDSREG